MVEGEEVLKELRNAILTYNQEGARRAAEKALEIGLDPLKALEEGLDLVFIHVEAPDEAGHAGDVEAKIKAIEMIDGEVVGRILDRIGSLDEKYRVAVLADHPTPIEVRTHTRDPVPVAVMSSGEEGDEVSEFDEFSARRGALGLLKGERFMELFIRRPLKACPR